VIDLAERRHDSSKRADWITTEGILVIKQTSTAPYVGAERCGDGPGRKRLRQRGPYVFNKPQNRTQEWTRSSNGFATSCSLNPEARLAETATSAAVGIGAAIGKILSQCDFTCLYKTLLHRMKRKPRSVSSIRREVFWEAITF